MKVAVIGAGAAGLVTGREFRDAGHEVRLFEQGKRLGGIWAYESSVEDDLLGLNPSTPIYSSIYDNLRTNLPSDLMAFIDYPFDEAGGGQAEWPRYPHHSCVLTYLQNFARNFELESLVSFESKVESAVPEQNGQSWRITVSSGEIAQFDAVAVCSGHFSKPRLLPITGADKFAGPRIHSHNYRRPGTFSGQRVAVIGTGASGADIVQALATQAKEVIWCGFEEPSPRRSIWCLPLPGRISETQLHFTDPEMSVEIDSIVYCTGYEYHMPFLDEALVQVQDNFVSPLYRDIVAPAWTRLGLIGLPFLVVPFPLYAMQARWFVSVIGGRVQLPSKDKMLAESQAEKRLLLDAGVKQRHLHRLGERQEDYYNSLARDCGEPLLPAWFGKLATEAQESRQRNPSGFRDEVLALPKQKPRVI
ncbi:MAG: cation diffusion facilitator CzcD-associated flavoprotein CzcO [Candidatus Azotimanducaceae bacterium]